MRRRRRRIKEEKGERGSGDRYNGWREGIFGGYCWNIPKKSIFGVLFLSLSTTVLYCALCHCVRR